MVVAWIEVQAMEKKIHEWIDNMFWRKKQKAFLWTKLKEQVRGKNQRQVPILKLEQLEGYGATP
jgi:hypothetical protein